MRPAPPPASPPAMAFGRLPLGRLAAPELSALCQGAADLLAAEPRDALPAILEACSAGGPERGGAAWALALPAAFGWGTQDPEEASLFAERLSELMEAQAERSGPLRRARTLAGFAMLGAFCSRPEGFPYQAAVESETGYDDEGSFSTSWDAYSCKIGEELCSSPASIDAINAFNLLLDSEDWTGRDGALDGREAASKLAFGMPFCLFMQGLDPWSPPRGAPPSAAFPDWQAIVELALACKLGGDLRASLPEPAKRARSPL